MNTPFIAAFCSPLIGLVLLSQTAQAVAAPTELAERGVFHFVSASGCPSVVSLPGSSEAECNRIALDISGARATIDTVSHTILVSSDATPDSKTVIGDVLLQGSGVAADGQRVPLSLQVLLRRSGTVWKTDTYVHAPVRSRFNAVLMDPYQISAREGATERVLLSAEQARNIVASPSLAARVASYFIGVYPSDEQKPSGDDIKITLGLGRLSKSLVQASFTSSEPNTVELSQLLVTGSWAIKLQALSGHIPVWAVQRQLFLFGLEGRPLLQDVRQHGLNKYDQLELGALNGKGYVRFNGREEAFPGAAASGQAFMQESFIGLILAWHRHSGTQVVPGSSTAQQSTL